MNSTQNTAHNTESVTCIKCDGRKVVNYGSVYDNRGVRSCFACGGVGTVTLSRLTDAERRRAYAARDEHETRCRFMKAHPGLNAIIDCHVEAGLLRGARDHFQRIGHEFGARNAAELAIYERCEPIVTAILARKAARPSEIEALRLAVMDLNELNPDWN